MKSITYIILLLILVHQTTNAQSPTSDNDFNIYKTELYDQYLNLVENQTYKIRRYITDFKIKTKLKLGSGFTTDFFSQL
ncbi:hypothetical protein GCM10023315_16360 [Algibacter aquimarinus]|uniref:GLPGLI family protein n=1 Tax=Algibacter aquimarinus TaxID=1136748 RepID=A0ABP9HCR9_9FLAO